MWPVLELPRPRAPLLARAIDGVRVSTPAEGAAPQSFERLPDGTATLLLRITSDGGARSPSARAGDLSLAGPRTRALYKTTPPAPLVLMVRFAPGGLSSFLGVPAHTLTDRIVRIEDVWGAEGARLRDAMVFAPSVDAMVAALQSALLGRARRTPEPAASRLARRAMQLIAQGAAPPRVDALAASLGVTARHLHRAFADTVGVGPKEFARGARLQRALHATGSPASWAQVAADAGYYDQAHMIADFRALVGVTPGAFARRAPGTFTW